MPIVEAILQDRGERYDGELPERAARRGDAKCDGSLVRRRLAGDRSKDRPETRRRHADAGEHVAEREHHALGRQRNHQHPGHVEQAPGRNRPRRAKPVRQIADEGREHTHQQHRQRGAERPQLPADVEVRSDRLLKNAEALARPNSDGQNRRPADHGNPEITLT